MSEPVGTPPDGYSFIPAEELEGVDDWMPLIREKMEAWQPEMTFARLTDTTGKFAKPGVPEGVWIQVWRVQPEHQAAFNPPLTVADPAPPTREETP